MKIEHIALWTRQLEVMRAFYCKHFDASCSQRYHNPEKQFTSYFLSFSGGARLELMSSPRVAVPAVGADAVPQGLIHLAFSTGSREGVVEKTEALREAGCLIAGEPRVTGDGYFESVVQDPDGNLIEITV